MALALKKNLNARSLSYPLVGDSGGLMLAVGGGCVCDHMCREDLSVLTCQRQRWEILPDLVTSLLPSVEHEDAQKD